MFLLKQNYLECILRRTTINVRQILYGDMYFDNLTNLRIENMFWYKDRLRLTVAAGCGVGGGGL